jgi:hypothetical protein
MGGSQSAMAFLDPPYNVRVRDIVGRGQIKHREFLIGSGELSGAGFFKFLKETIGAAAAVSRDGSSAITSKPTIRVVRRPPPVQRSSLAVPRA